MTAIGEKDDRLIVVLDLGKTLAKLSLWTSQGEQLERITRANRSSLDGASATLDLDGIHDWRGSALAVSGRKARAPIGAIIPVGHGAAAVLVLDGEVLCPPLDYETPIDGGVRQSYDRERSPFAITGSLPDGLNLGAQFAALEARDSSLFDERTRVLLWPQFWAWLISGVLASEATSLGCHSDLWHPAAGKASRSAERRGWRAMLPLLRHAGDAHSGRGQVDRAPSPPLVSWAAGKLKSSLVSTAGASTSSRTRQRCSKRIRQSSPAARWCCRALPPDRGHLAVDGGNGSMSRTDRQSCAPRSVCMPRLSRTRC